MIIDSLHNYFLTIADNKINTNNANAGHIIESDASMDFVEL
jgi:hypothetical protein